MEERHNKALFMKSGTGSLNSRINIPITWIRDMGLSKEHPQILLLYDDKAKQILIKKDK